MLAFLAPRAIPGIERVENGSYVRRLRHGLLTVRPGGEGALRVDLALPAPLIPAGLEASLRALFDLDADAAAIDAHLARDPLLAPHVAARPGVRVPGAFDPFEVAVRAVLGQQVTVRGATTLAGRLVERFGEELAEGRLFPAPGSLASAGPERIAAIGMPAARARCLHGLAHAVATGRLDFAAPDAATTLPQLFGIGPWTTAYVAMRALRDADAFPEGDLGVRNALGGLNAKQARERARAWSPWRAYATMRVWGLLSPTSS